jgi:arginine decarboxylase-like protein
MQADGCSPACMYAAGSQAHSVVGCVQISNICIIKESMREASFLYAELVALGAAMGTLDVGGGC